MSCRLVRRHMGALVDGELDPATQIDFERHLEICVECQEFHAFERAMREQVRESCGNVEIPAEVLERLRARLVAEGERESGLWRVHLLRPRYAIPVAAAAALLLFVAPYSQPTQGADAQGAGGPLAEARLGGVPGVDAMTPLLRDVVRLHSSELPSDVQAPQDDQVARYFQGKVEFPVRPAHFERPDVRLVGARLSNVRDRRAAALYYEVRGRRVTMVVFDSPSPSSGPGVLKVRLRGRDVFYQDVQGHAVPVRWQSGLNYAFAGDLDRRALFELAASARVPR